MLYKSLFKIYSDENYIVLFERTLTNETVNIINVQIRTLDNNEVAYIEKSQWKVL